MQEGRPLAFEKRLSSKEQQKWVAKMQGFDFEIIYKKGKDNVVVDALSRIEEASSLYSITSSIHVWLEEAHHEWQEDNSTRQKIQCLKEGRTLWNIGSGREISFGTRVEYFYALNQS
jgi:hypothetical protein